MKNYSFLVRNKPLRNSLGGLTTMVVPGPTMVSGRSMVKGATKYGRNL
jgi:hypothetical protein